MVPINHGKNRESETDFSVKEPSMEPRPATLLFILADLRREAEYHSDAGGRLLLRFCFRLSHTEKWMTNKQ